MTECVLIYFLSFAQIEEKSEPAEKKKLVVPLKLLFLLDYYYCHCSFAGVGLFPPCFCCERNSEHLRET